jgi:hypothetical protein
MFGLPLRLASGAKADGVGRRNVELGAMKSFAIGAAEAFWLALIAASFVLWAMSPSGNGSGAISSTGCLFAGKAGIVCNGSAANTGRQTEAENAYAACVSLGRGGRVCPPARQ